MFQSMWEDIKREFSYGNTVTRLIIVNIAFFVGINALKIILNLANGLEPSELYITIQRGLMISTDWWHNLTKPWVIFTHMFMHIGFFHILWNMLLLYWFGRIVGDFLGNQRVLPLYLLAGLAGALAFFALYNLFPGLKVAGPQYALGASAAVMGIIVAAAVTSPDYVMYLLFIGGVKLKYIAAVLIFLDLLGVADNINTGGHFAHLGGAVMGWLFVTQLRSGNDLAIPTNNIIDRIFSFFRGVGGVGKRRSESDTRSKRKTRRKKSGSNVSAASASKQARVDQILDKIKDSGYDSLSDEEKEFLFKASKDN